MRKKFSDKIWSMKEELNEVVEYINFLHIQTHFEKNLTLVVEDTKKLKILITEFDYFGDLKETGRLIRKIETGRL